MIVMIDNYDSFVHNLARYFERLGHIPHIVRNDAVTIENVKAMKPHAVVISPGPCTPQESGISVNLIRAVGNTTPILGVCLGHQAIGEAYGGQTIRARAPVHGKATQITHDGSPLFKNIPSPMQAGRYHSLITALPENADLLITALSEDNEIMGIRHKHFPVHGIQFHPESILTPHGAEIIRNFLHLAQDWHTENKSNENKDHAPHE